MNFKKLYFIKFFLVFLFVILILIKVNYYLPEKYCLKCININKNKCFQCPIELIFKGLKIINDENTLEEIINTNKSISRFGDGEFEFMLGNSLDFQNFNQSLSNKLKDILNTNEKGLLIAINIPYKFVDLNKFNKNAKNYYINWLQKRKFSLAKMFNKSRQYYSSTITRFYIDYENKNGTSDYIKKLKKIWNKKEIVIIEGEKSRVGLGNNLMDNAKSIKRILCPSKDAFNKYPKIIETILNKVDKNKLLLISLGPTATVLAYDLYKLGYRALDIGHIDIEYEWYLRNATKKIQIENKLVIEAPDFNNNTYIIKDKNYYSQIIAKITD